MSLTLPNRVSIWNEKHLSELRISYDDEPTELSDFMALLKEGSEKKRSVYQSIASKHRSVDKLYEQILEIFI